MPDTLPAFRLAREEMTRLGQSLAGQFAAATPFPHVVVDDFLPVPVLRSLVDTYPGPADLAWHEFDAARQIKLACEDEAVLPPAHLQVLRELNGQAFLAFLEALTGIEALLPDPYFRGGGLHQIRRGGLLKVHADFNMHPRLHVQRRLNALLYLNENWQEFYGGALELWDRDMTGACARIYPVANRLVVFATTDDSFHGHPEPLACPEGRTRRSMAWYYYTAPTGLHVPRPHSTLFRARPGEDLPAGNAGLGGGAGAGRTARGALRTAAGAVRTAAASGGRRLADVAVRIRRPD